MADVYENNKRVLLLNTVIKGLSNNTLLFNILYLIYLSSVVTVHIWNI